MLLSTVLLPTQAQTPAPGYLSGWGNFRGLTPIGLDNVIAIAGGKYHAVALKSDGTVVAWGDNELGQLDVPAGLADVVAVAAGSNHSVALRADGTVVGWGLDDFGQVSGAAGVTDVVAIAAASD